ncbi:protein AMN1 homolog isoform X2 [Zootermopsis nevadensis]|uniref:AMN1-like protein n=1 Tax=Zootermopsis nevadensis TaxID=136037 RepID=A0A067R1X7_ZOONE|nr:protein AMN1 homolog isoform X2 [Zootermopsis nevadensis]KDR17008.1 AMN1-like protein [Zootermopsis nevadensis]
MLPEHVWETDRSLLTLCVNKVVQDMEQHVDTVQVLPRSLKSKLLLVASKRGKLTVKGLHCLVHPDVKILNLSECNACDDFIHAIHKCTHLKKLYLNPGMKQRDISTAVLLDLFPSIPYLSGLYLRQCPTVTDEVMASIANSCPLLTELDIGGCSAVTDTSLKLLKKLQYLTSLNISHSQVSDIGISALVQGECRKSLTELQLQNSPRITEVAIEAIVLHCTNMKVLIFHGCPISAASRVALGTLFAKSQLKQLTWTIY